MKPFLTGTKAQMRIARFALKRALGLPKRDTSVPVGASIPEVHSPCAPGWTDEAVPPPIESDSSDEAAIFVPEDLDHYLGQGDIPSADGRMSEEELPVGIRDKIAAVGILLAGCQPSAPVRVFIFAGQSNMAGADSVIDPVTRTKDLVQVGQQTAEDASSSFTWLGGGSSYIWSDIRGHATAYMGQASPGGGVPYKGHGPEVGFSRELGGNVAIIKYTANFSALEDGKSPWRAPGSKWAAWQAFVDEQLAALGRPYEIQGFVWIQGIDDGLQHRTQVAYTADLRAIVSDLRAKFGNKPFVLARSINSAIANPFYMAPIRAGQLDVAADAGNAWTDLDDLTPYVNTHHLTAASQLVSGARLAAAWRELDAVTVNP